MRRKPRKRKKTAGLLNPAAFYCCAAGLFNKLKTVYKKAFPANESTFEKYPLAQMPRTETSSLSVRAIFLSTMILFSHDLSDERETAVASAEARSQHLAGAVSLHFLPQREFVTLGKRKNRSPSPMTRTDSGRLERPVSTSPAGFDFRLPPADSLSNQSCEGGHKEGSMRRTSVIEPESENEVSTEKPRSAQDAEKRDPPSVGTGLKLSRMLWKRKMRRHGQFQISISETLPMRYKMRCYPAELDVSADFKKDSRPPSAVRDEALNFRSSGLVSFFHSALIN